jgi:hypothetical protein
MAKENNKSFNIWETVNYISYIFFFILGKLIQYCIPVFLLLLIFIYIPYWNLIYSNNTSSKSKEISEISVAFDLPNELKIQQEKEIIITLHNNSEKTIYIQNLSVQYPFTFIKSEKTISLRPLKVVYPVWLEENVLITDKAYPSYIEGYKDEKYYPPIIKLPFIHATSINYFQTHPSRVYFTILPGQDLIIHIPIIGKFAQNYTGLIRISGYAYDESFWGNYKKFYTEEFVNISISQ